MARRQETIYFLNAVARAINTIQRLKRNKPKKLMKDIDEMAKSVIAKWYASYPSPIYYNRRRGLYHAYKLEKDGIDIEITFEASYLAEFADYHQDVEIVYNNAFMEGWHGGSMGTDRNGETAETPRWRTPYPTVKNVREGKEPYTDWSKLKVKKSKSPYEQILKQSEKLMEEYDAGWEEDLEEKVMKPLNKSLGGLKRK